MVFSSAVEDYISTMGRERPKIRHNFILPDLKWGVQRSLRCVKVQLDGGVDNRNRRLRISAEDGGEEGIEEYGEKMTSYFITEAEKMKESTFREQVVDYEEEREREASPPGIAAEVKPWNLRKRRAEAPITESGAKFMSTLSKKEMEDDYMTMMGHRPPRRPKKRLRTLQKQIDLLHPTLYFTQITEDIYQVPDAAENRKR